MNGESIYCCLVCQGKTTSGFPFCSKCYKDWKTEQKSEWVKYLLSDQQKRIRRLDWESNTISIDAWRDHEYVRIQED